MIAAVGAAALIGEGMVRARGGLAAGDIALALLTASPLAWRTSSPLVVLGAVEIGSLACAVAFDATFAATTLIIVELYTVAVLGDRQRSIVVGAVTAIVVVAAITIVEGSVDLGSIMIRVPLVFVALACGDTVRSRRALRIAAAERQQREAHQREEESHRRVTNERLRIARELHDTLAHSLVAMNVRAGVALDLRDAQDPYDALDDVKRASATALGDLRATLSLLREQDDMAPTAPVRGLDAVSGLVDHARATGLQADVDLQLDGADVPTAIAGAAFRIVQESLTNVLRHADASHAQIRIRAHRETLDIEIVDDGKADSGSAISGLGLRGMTERATAVGGHVDVGPRQAGGWRVQAVLPLTGADAR